MESLDFDELYELLEVQREELKKLRARVAKLERAANGEDDDDEEYDDRAYAPHSGYGGDD